MNKHEALNILGRREFADDVIALMEDTGACHFQPIKRMDPEVKTIF